MSDAAPHLPPSYDPSPAQDSPAPAPENDDADDTALNDAVDELPDYSTLSPRNTTTPRSAITTSRAPRDFEYKIESKGNPVVVLTVCADPLVSKNVPTFVGKGPIKGKVSLNLSKPETIQSIAITVFGRYASGIDNEEVIFLELSNTLLSQGEDVRRDMLPESTSGGVRPDGKLYGSHTWAFALDIPTELTVPAKPTGLVSFAPPHTFTERALRGSVTYSVSVKVKRGKLKADHKITVPIGYIPVLRPPPFSGLRRIAYQEGSTVLGPDIDPEGWQALEKVEMKGTLFKTRPISVACILFLAKPLSYTRGSVIPLCLRLASDDQQAVDLLRTPQAIVVRLQRRLNFHVPQKKLKNPENLNLATGKEIRDVVDALWWPSTTQVTDSTSPVDEHVRYINGELHLGNELKPTSLMPYFKIEYFVVLLPFSTPGLDMPESDKALREQKVEIVTSFAPGPRAVRAAPPGYDMPGRDRINIVPFLSTSGFI